MPYKSPRGLSSYSKSAAQNTQNRRRKKTVFDRSSAKLANCGRKSSGQSQPDHNEFRNATCFHSWQSCFDCRCRRFLLDAYPTAKAQVPFLDCIRSFLAGRCFWPGRTWGLAAVGLDLSVRGHAQAQMVREFCLNLQKLYELRLAHGEIGERETPRTASALAATAALGRFALFVLSCILFRWRIHKSIETIKTLILFLYEAAIFHFLGRSRNRFGCWRYLPIITVQAFFGLILNVKAGPQGL
jgi:hypothetical protein